MIRIVRKLCKQSGRQFSTDLEALAKTELTQLIQASPKTTTGTKRPQYNVKLVAVDEENKELQVNQTDWLKKDISLLRTEEQMKNFLAENGDLIQGSLIVDMLEQLFEVFNRIKRGGSTVTQIEFLSSPYVKPVFSKLLDSYRSLTGSQLSAFVSILCNNGYKDLNYFRLLEDYIAEVKTANIFKFSPNQLFKCLATLSAAGLPLTISIRQVNALATKFMAYMGASPPSKVAAFIYYYHKLVFLIWQQSIEESSRSSKSSLPSSEGLQMKDEVDVLLNEGFENSVQEQVLSPQKKNGGQKLKFPKQEIELVDFKPQLFSFLKDMDLPSIALVLNSYSFVDRDHRDPSVQIVVKKMIDSISLDSIDDIEKVLKALVNVGIKEPAVFTDILAETKRQLALIEGPPKTPFSPEKLLMIHYYLVKFDVGPLFTPVAGH